MNSGASLSTDSQFAPEGGAYLLLQFFIFGFEDLLVVLDFQDVCFCGFDNRGLLGDGLFQAVNELSDLLVCDPSGVVPHTREFWVRARCSDNFVSIAFLLLQGRIDSWKRRPRLLVCPLLGNC